MANILALANEVARELCAHNAEVAFAPEFDLKDIETARVVVVPAGIEYKPLSRSTHEELYKISVGILKRCTEDDLEAMVCLSQDTGKHFLNLQLGDAICVGVEYAPLYSPEHLRERRQFTSVLVLSFKSLVREIPQKR